MPTNPPAKVTTTDKTVLAAKKVDHWLISRWELLAVGFVIVWAALLVGATTGLSLLIGVLLGVLVSRAWR